MLVDFFLNNETVLYILSVSGMIVTASIDSHRAKLSNEILFSIFYLLIFINVLINGIFKGF